MKEVELRENGSLTRKFLRVFGLDRDFLQPPEIREDKAFHVNISASYNDLNSIRSALLEAERQKTEALIERQRSSFA